MLLQKSMHFHPGLESQHLANGGFGEAFCPVALKGQCLKRDTRRVLALGGDLPCKLVRYLEGDLHGLRIAYVPFTCGRTGAFLRAH